LLDRLVILSPFGVFPARSGGHSAVLEPARFLARTGVDVHLFGLGVRRFEAFRHFRSFVREIEPRLVEERHVSLWNWLDYLRRGRSGLPALDAADFLDRKASDRLRTRCEQAGALQYEGPWLFPFVPCDRPRILVAHNCEAALIEDLDGVTREQREKAADLEAAAWTGADRVICFTEADRGELAARYGDREAEVVPLGVDTDSIRPPDPDAREAARRELDVGDRCVVLFTGGWHRPNRAAADRMREWAASVGEGLLLVVAGSVGERAARSDGLRVTGPVPDLAPWFTAADVCVNPMTDGSGANVKLLEYLAWGRPVVSTPFGARGIDVEDGVHLLLREPEDFPDALRELRGDPELARRLGAAGRRLVEAARSWDSIGARRLRILSEAAGRANP
jgi:glycosyltransferase involved in cell wall biosynthesis